MVGAMFIGRDPELSFLEELHGSARPEFYVLYGRRRVGKTELLQQFCQRHRSIYFLATQQRDRDNLRAFRQAIVEGLGDELAATIDFPDWTTALSFVAERAKGERLTVVLDEFPYLCEAQKSVPSQLQRFWDTRGKKSSLLLILCGSQVSFMETEVLSEKSPLFGRRTSQKRLEPLAPRDTLGFFPKWKLQDRVLAYAILGGMPAYLARFDDALTLSENVQKEILRPEGFLFDEAQFLLRTELTNPATYNSILAAVSRGAQRLNDIALEVGVDATTANKYLTVLRELELVEREVPLYDPDPLRSRRGTYRIADRFLQFHFRYLQPHLSLVHAGRGSRVLEEFVQPDFPRLLDEARTEFILDHLARESADLLGEEVTETGRFPGVFVRAIGRTARGNPVAAIVVPDGERELAPLERELGELREAMSGEVKKLVYGLTARVDRPLEVELVPKGELL